MLDALMRTRIEIQVWNTYCNPYHAKSSSNKGEKNA